VLWVTMGQDDTGDLVRKAQAGSVEARETLISQHQGFIKKLVLKNVTGYEDISNRDEYSVGLMAFNEAISSYKPGLRSFRSFAADVIKRRLIDYRRSLEQHQKRVVYIEDLPRLPAKSGSSGAEEKVELRLEFEAFVARLAQYGISLRDLVKETPRHADSRLLCVRIARAITGESEMCSHFVKYGTIPLRQVCEKIGVNPKTVGRHRKYIIALCLVLLSDMETMKQYVRGMGEGGDDDA